MTADVYTYFDVGANWGERSLPDARANPNWRVWAFEPTPHLAEYLRRASHDFQSRYHVEAIALSDQTGLAKFNIQNHPGQGCNSLNDFSEGLDKIFPHFCNPDRNDLIAVDHILVPTFRLDQWLDQHPEITKIDYYKSDAQGSDLAILRGMGDRIGMIRSGEAEASRSARTKLYRQNHTVEEIVEYLKERGFRVPKILNNDHLDNEYNVYFEQP